MPSDIISWSKWLVALSFFIFKIKSLGTFQVRLFMPRKFFKKISPSPQKIVALPRLAWLQEKIKKPNIWGYTRANISRAVFIGLFWAMIPIPLQMVAAAISAYRFSANIPVSVALVWITNPITIPIIFYLQYLLGSYILGSSIDHQVAGMSWRWLKHSFHQIAPPFLLGAAICAIVLPIIGYIMVNQIWIWRVQKLQKNKRNKNKSM